MPEPFSGAITPSLLLATTTADKAGTFVALFFAQLLSWAGVPALGAAASGAAGALASQGTLELWAVLVVGTAGAEVGSVGGWWMGNRVARAGLDGEGRFDEKRRQALAAGEKIAQKWGPLMVFFVPSWVSGAMGMKLRQFVVWNLPAALLWNLGSALAAYGIVSAASGGSLVHVVIPILIALGAVWATRHIFRAFIRRHHHHHEPSPIGAPEGQPPPADVS